MTEPARKHNITRHAAVLFSALIIGLLSASAAYRFGWQSYLITIALVGTLSITAVALFMMRGRSCPGCRRVNARTTITRESLAHGSRHQYVYVHRCKFCKDTWTRRG